MRHKRLTRGEKRSKRKKVIIISTLCLLLVMTIGYAAFQTNLNITAKGNVKEKSRIIQSWTSASQEDFHSDFYKQNIVTATFLDSSVVPSNALESWDVSETKDKGVMAWVIPNNEDNTKYDLYIGANNGVIANEDSSYLFYNFNVITSIEFGKNFDTSNVTNMYAMFSNCMEIVDLNLEIFDTENVVNMADMFSLTYKLENLNVSNFHTNNVTSFWHMFRDCKSLKYLNLCSFDTRKVTNMASMFWNTPLLTAIYVGPNWVISENTDITDMFFISNISSVTTGQC